MSDPLKPSPTLLCKLGSLIVHVDEMLSPSGHHFDKTAVEGLLKEQEVAEWLTAMGKLGFLPLKR